MQRGHAVSVMLYVGNFFSRQLKESLFAFPLNSRSNRVVVLRALRRRGYPR